MTQTTDHATTPEPTANPETLLNGADLAIPSATPTAHPLETPDKTDDSLENQSDYTEFQVPEGVSLNPELLTEFKQIAKDLGLSQAAAQQLTDLGVKLSQKLQVEQATRHSADKHAWREAALNDPEFGGKQLPENLALAAKAMQALAGPGLKAVLDSSGLGNHPELIRAFIKAGKLLSEDKLVPGGSAPQGSKTLAQRLYPQQN